MTCRRAGKQIPPFGRNDKIQKMTKLETREEGEIGFRGSLNAKERRPRWDAFSSKLRLAYRLRKFFIDNWLTFVGTFFWNPGQSRIPTPGQIKPLPSGRNSCRNVCTP